MGDERLTYAELAQRSDRLAAQLIAVGCVPGDRVGLLVPKCPMAIVAMHAALKAGAVYVPLDTESPAAATRAHRRGGRAATAAGDVGGGRSPRRARGGGALPPVWSLEDEPIAGERVHSERARAQWDLDAQPPGVRVDADDPAHMLFTSGSTGQPKGVVITHRNVTAFVEWARAPLRDSARATASSGHPPLHFDLSTFDVYGALARRRRAAPRPSRALNLDPRALASLHPRRRADQWFSVPSVMTYMAKLRVVARGRLPRAPARDVVRRGAADARCSPTGCDRLPHVHVHESLRADRDDDREQLLHVPDVPADETAPIPIGVACAGEELLVLDDRLRPAPAGEIGDLYIGGVGLSPGYWRDEEKTAPRSCADPRDPERRAHLPDRRSRARRRRRPRVLPRPRRLADQEPRLPDRARRDRERAQRDRRRARVRGRRSRSGGLRGHGDLLRLRRRRRRSSRPRLRRAR